MEQPKSLYTAVVKARIQFHYKVYPDEEMLESLQVAAFCNELEQQMWCGRCRGYQVR